MIESTTLKSLEEISAVSEGRRVRLHPLLILALLALLSIPALLARFSAEQPETEPGTAPPFEVTTFDGQLIRLSDLRGQVVLLNFWASWCRPCREEAPVLQAIAELYPGRVIVVGIAYADVDASSRAFIEEFGLTYANAPDIDGQVSSQYRLFGVPQTFVIDQRGIQVDMLIGSTQVNVENISEIINQLLEHA